MKKETNILKSTLIGLLGLLAFGSVQGQVIVKTQIPGLVVLAASPISESRTGTRPIAPYIFLEVEKSLGDQSSVLAYGAFRTGRDESDPIEGVGTPFWEVSGFKIGAAYRRYVSSTEPLEGFYLQPTIQLWQGEFQKFSGDTFQQSERLGASITLHGGYQIIVSKGLTLDGSLGLGLGTEQVDGNLEDLISGYHYLNPQGGGIGLAVDGRLGIGWSF